MATAEFSWDVEPGHVEYEITYQDITNSGPQFPATGVIAPANVATITGLLDNTEYKFCVRALCESGEYSTWSCINQTTPEKVPMFKLGARLYRPGAGSVTGCSMDLKNSALTIWTQANITFLYQQVNAELSEFSDNRIIADVTFSSAKCEAIYVYKNGSIVHGLLFNLATGNSQYTFDFNTITYPSNIEEDDVIDIVFVIANDQSVAGDPYVHPSYVGQCNNINPIDI